MKKYIRFGEIPKNERSGIYAGDAGKIGEEIGVSCYDCVCINEEYRVLLPSCPSRYTCPTLHNLYDAYIGGEINMYIITGREVGKGTDNEPLLIDVKILSIIKNKNFE